jgi:hypothetical protein
LDPGYGFALELSMETKSPADLGLHAVLQVAEKLE